MSVILLPKEGRDISLISSLYYSNTIWNSLLKSRLYLSRYSPLYTTSLLENQKQDVSLSDIYMLSGLSLLLSSLTLNGLHEVTRPIFAHLHKQTEEGKKCFTLNNVSLMSF